MSRRLVASFLVRLIHEPDNEQIPWNITVQHVQSGRVYRLADPEAIASLLQEVTKEENHLQKDPAVPL
ncbi:MAG: hypothetical protein AB1556_01855 [Bacillota bacterium]